MEIIMNKKVFRLITMCLVLTILSSLFTINVFADGNKIWGVKVQATASYWLCTNNSYSNAVKLNSWKSDTTTAIGAIQYDTPYAVYGRASDDVSMHFVIPKVYGNNIASDSGNYIYDFFIYQPSTSLTISSDTDNPSYVYYNFAIAFKELPSSNQTYFRVMSGSNNDLNAMLPKHEYFTETGRWYNVGIQISVVKDGSLTSTLYIDGKEVKSDTKTSPKPQGLKGIALAFVNTDSTDTGNYDFYIDDVYVEYGANKPTLINDTVPYPTETSTFTSNGNNSIVAHSATATVADFYSWLSNASVDITKFAVRDTSGTSYGTDSTDLILGKYVVYSDTTYGATGLEKKLETFTAAVTSDDSGDTGESGGEVTDPDPEEGDGDTDSDVILPRVTFDLDEYTFANNSTDLTNIQAEATLYHNGADGVTASTDKGKFGRAPADNSMFIGRENEAELTDSGYGLGVIYQKDGSSIDFTNDTIWEFSVCATGDILSLMFYIGDGTSDTQKSPLKTFTVTNGLGSNERGILAKDRWNKIAVKLTHDTKNFEIYVNGTKVTSGLSSNVSSNFNDATLSQIYIRPMWDKETENKTYPECVGGVWIDDITLYDKENYTVADFNEAPARLTATGADISTATNYIYTTDLTNIELSSDDYVIVNSSTLGDGSILAVSNTKGDIYDYYTVKNMTGIDNWLLLYPTEDGVLAETYLKTEAKLILAGYLNNGSMLNKRCKVFDAPAGLSQTTEVISRKNSITSIKGFLLDNFTSFSPLIDYVEILNF